MFGTNLFISLNPNMLNKLKEKDVNENIINIAISKGYKISNKTPSFLFKYDQIIDLLLSDANNIRRLGKEDVIDILRNSNRYEDVLNYVINNYDGSFYINCSKLFDGYYDLIPVIEKNIDLISTIGLDYIKANPDYVYSEFFNLSYKRSLLDYFLDRSNNIDISRVKGINSYMDKILKVYPELINDPKISIDDNLIVSLVKEGIYKIEDLVDTKYFNNCFRELLSISLEPLKYVSSLNDNINSRVIFDLLINNITTNYQYIHDVYRLTEHVDENQKLSLVKAIKDNNLPLVGDLWDFIYNDIEYVMDHLRNDISLIDDFSINEYNLSEEYKKEIIDLIISSNYIPVNFYYFYPQDEIMLNYLVTNNPYIFKNYLDGNLSEMLRERGIKLDLSNFSSGFFSEEEYLDAVRLDPSLVSQRNNHDRSIDEADRIAIDTGVEPTNNNSSLLLLRDIRKGLNHNIFGGSDFFSTICNKYLISNGVNYNGSLYYNLTGNFDLKSKLEEDFSYVINYNFTNDENRKIIADVYFKNHEENKKYIDLVNNNIYIIVGEMLDYNNYSFNLNYLIKDKVCELYTSEFIKRNGVINKDNIIYIRDSKLIFNAVMNDLSLLQCFDRIRYNFILELDKDSKVVLFNKIFNEGLSDYYYYLDADFIYDNLDSVVKYASYDFIKDTFIEEYDLTNDSKYLDIIIKYLNEGKILIDRKVFDVLPDDMKNICPYLDNKGRGKYSLFFKRGDDGNSDPDFNFDIYPEFRKYLLDGNPIPILNYSFFKYIYNDSIDYELLEYISNKNINVFIQMLNSLDLLDGRVLNIFNDKLYSANEFELSEVFSALSSFSNYNTRDLIDNVVVEYINNNKNSLSKRIMVILDRYKKCFNDEEYYNIWKKDPFKIENETNPYVLRDLLINGDLDDLDHNLYNNPKLIGVIFEYFKDKDLSSYLDKKFFFTNPLLLSTYMKEFSININDLIYKLFLKHPENIDEYIEYTPFLKYLSDLEGIESSSFFLDFPYELLKKDFDKYINLFGEVYYYKNIDDIDNIAEEINYVINPNTPIFILKNASILENSFKLDPNSIKYAIPYMEDIKLSWNSLIPSFFFDNKIYGIKNKSLLSNNAYLLESIKLDPYIIDSVMDCSLKHDEMVILQQIVLDNIKSGKYILSINTPIELLYNEELFRIALENCPELAKKSILYSTIPRKSYIEEAMNDINNVDIILGKSDRWYTSEELKPLVDELISINYQLTSNTPKCLLYDYNFLYYVIKNNNNVDDNLINRFVSFEGLYVCKDKELFKVLLNKGYGKEFIPFISKYGLNNALDLVMNNGKYLSLLREYPSNIDNISLGILNGISYNRMYYDYYYRLNDFKCLQRIKYFDSSGALELFLKDPDKYRDGIIESIKCGAYINDKNFVFDEKLLYLFLKYSPSNYIVFNIINKMDISSIEENIILNILDRGLEIDDKTNNQLFNNPLYLKKMLEVNKSKLIEQVKYIPKELLTDDIIKYALGLNNNIEFVKYLGDNLLANNISKFTINLLIDNDYYIDNNSSDVFKETEYFNRILNNLDKKNKYGIFYSSISNVNLDGLVSKENIDIILKNILKYHAKEEDFIVSNRSFEEKKEILLKLMNDIKKISHIKVKNSYAKYIISRLDKISIDDMSKVKDFLYKIEQSNSGEIRHFAHAIVDELLKTEDYEEAFVDIENIFLKNNLPMVGKIYSIFKVLHKDYSILQSNSSPVLKKYGKIHDDMIIFIDLLKSFIGSNNRNLRNYITSIKNNVPLLEGIENGSVDYDSLSDEDKKDLNQLIKYLFTLSNQTLKGRYKDPIYPSDDIYENIRIIRELYSDSITHNKDYSLSERICEMFAYKLGFNNLDEVIYLMDKISNDTSSRNRDAADREFSIEVGDFVKGLKGINYIETILQNGSVSKEFLGEAADSDATPLDTDLSRVFARNSISNLACGGYGPIWIVLKNRDGKFQLTRDNDGDKEDIKYDVNKLEIFYTGAIGKDHYGIRTGFASSDIDFFLVDSLDNRLKLLIAMNNFYIPIVDKNTMKLLFTYDEYVDLRNKMSGLDYVNGGKYQIASLEELYSPMIEKFAEGIIPNREKVLEKHKMIQKQFSEGCKDFNISFKDELNGDISFNSAELFDTGSTSRCTDLPGKADFDYICRIDRTMYIDEGVFSKFRDVISSKFEFSSSEYLEKHHKLSFHDVKLEGIEEPVEIEISFIEKTNKMNFSSEGSLKSRLDTIRNGNCVSINENDVDGDYSSRYPLVVANILMAKALFKKYHCYKKHGSNPSEGGLGGIGIENWILQHGGSLKLACEDFMKYASVARSYDDFKRMYQVFDFGENHYALADGEFVHDEFVYKNMDAEGYERMKNACQYYLTYGDKALSDEILEETEAKSL